MSHTHKTAAAVNPPAVAANASHVHESMGAAPASNADTRSTQMRISTTKDVRYIHNTYLRNTGSHLCRQRCRNHITHRRKSSPCLLQQFQQRPYVSTNDNYRLYWLCKYLMPVKAIWKMHTYQLMCLHEYSRRT